MKIRVNPLVQMRFKIQGNKNRQYCRRENGDNMAVNQMTMTIIEIKNVVPWSGSTMIKRSKIPTTVMG